MRKSIYKLFELNGETLKKPLEMLLEQTEDEHWKASVGSTSAVSPDRNECLQKLIKLLETPKAKTKESK